MHSVRWFLVVWSLATVLIVSYAFADLSFHPWLRLETHFSMQPDIAHADELVHWGGRLLKQGYWWLLVANALVLGGILALVVGGALRAVRRDREPDRVAARLSIP